MKKLIITSLAAIALTACSELGTRNPGGSDQEVYVQVDTLVYQVYWVTVAKNGQGFYMMTPVGAEVNVTHTLPEVLGYSEGKHSTSIIKVK